MVIRKKRLCFTSKSNLHIKNPMYFNKKVISYYIIFQTNLFIKMATCVPVDSKSDSRQRKA